MSKKAYFVFFILGVFLLISTSNAFAFKAPKPPGGKRKAPGPAGKVTSAGSPARVTASQRSTLERFTDLSVTWDRSKGVPRSIRGFNRKAPGDPVREAISFLDEIGASFRMKNAYSETRLRMLQRDRLGFEHVRVTQYYRGLPVVGGELVVHINSRKEIYEVNGSYYPDIDLSIVPGISSGSALSVGLRDFTSEPELALAEGPELVIYPAGNRYYLAYRYVITFGLYDEGRWVYYIDAHTGEVINSYDDIKYIPPPTTNGSHENISGNILSGEGGGSATVEGWHDLTNSAYYLWNKNLYWYVFDVLNPLCGSATDQGTYAYRATSDWATSDATEMSAANNLYYTQDFFKNVLGRDSFDDAGSYCRANVHLFDPWWGQNGYPDWWGCYNVDAYYSPSNNTINFGDGDGVTANALTVLDVVAHEFGHAWTQYTSSLVYQYESGALDESFSDIIGVSTEFYAQPDGSGSYPAAVPGQADWLMGEDAWVSSTALRDMRDPSNTSTVGAGGEQPSRYKGTYWYFGDGDNGGVHKNSGVQNFFYYLLCEGGSGLNDGLPYNVTGISLANARLVAYRANTYYLVSSDDYYSVRNAWVSAATDLNPSWVSSVEDAWDAVGVLEGMGTYSKDEDPDKQIPDDDSSGITSYILISNRYFISYINVFVDITHDWIGDLVVEVISPTGTMVKLHDRSGGSTSDIYGWYDREIRVDAGNLIDFYGEDSRGFWTLRVSDNDSNNIGTLNQWKIEIFGSTSALSSPWPMFRQNKKHTGRARVSGPLYPTLKWSYLTGDTVTSSPAVGYYGTVFVGSKDGKLYSLNSDGTFLWTYDTGYYIRSSPALGDDSVVYIGGHNADSFHCLNSDGTLNWSYNAGTYVRSSPVIGSDAEVYFGSDDNNLYSINADGSFRWSYAAGYYVSSSPALGGNGEIYFGSDDYRLYALTPSGSLIWSYLCGNAVQSSPAISSDGGLHYGSHDNNLYALNSYGVLSWSFTTGGFISSSPALGSDGNSYVGSGDGNLYAISSDGALIWSYTTGSSIAYSSPAIGTGGRIYFGSEDNRIYGLTRGGGMSWSYVAGSSVRSSPAIADDGSLIVGSDDGRIYAINKEEAVGLAVIKKEGVGDINLYYYNSLFPGDWTYWDTLARNPVPVARDLWIIPAGNDAVGIAATELTGDLKEELLVLKREGLGDVNLYLYNGLLKYDWTYWDAVSRNPSPLGRDLWVIPFGNDAIGIAALDITGGGTDELALLKEEGVSDMNLYFYCSPVPGDWTFWDALSRNPSPLARDLWIMPQGNDAIGIAAFDANGDGTKELAILKKEGAADINLYLYNSLVAGDWTYQDALARNPSPLARDLWFIPSGNDAVAIAALDRDLDGKEELVILKREGVNDINLYYYNSLVIGDWTYWDAMARNPSALARDLWVIPSGNDAAGMTAVRIDD